MFNSVLSVQLPFEFFYISYFPLVIVWSLRQQWVTICNQIVSGPHCFLGQFLDSQVSELVTSSIEGSKFDVLSIETKKLVEECK